MNTIEATNEHPASSLARFFASHAKQYHAMANAPMQASSGDTRTMIDFETAEMYELHKRGMMIKELSAKYEVNAVAISRRFQRRGFRVIRNKKA